MYDKISKLRISLTILSPHTHPLLQLNIPISLLTPASESEIYKILFNCPNKQSDSNPIPTWLLKVCAPVLIPTIINIVNLSLTSGHFHPILKESVISPTSQETYSRQRPTFQLSANLQPVSHI